MKEKPALKISKAPQDGFLRFDVAFEKGAERVLKTLSDEFRLDLWSLFRGTVKREARRLRKYNPSPQTRGQLEGELERAAREFAKPYKPYAGARS